MKKEGISYSEFKDFDEETKDAYDWAYKNADKRVLADAVTGNIVKYRKYTKTINAFRSDDNMSAKDKKIEYINGLDLDYGQKIILFKSEYKSNDTYNYEIIDYLNSRDDISYGDMKNILTELGFKVDAAGNITW